MFKGYHIIIVPKDKAQTKSFRVSGLSLKIILFCVALSIPLVFVAVLSAIHYQNKLIALKRSNYENRLLVKQKDELTSKMASLEKTITLMNQSIDYLGELMDVDLHDMKLGLGPISDTDLTLPGSADDIVIPDMDPTMTAQEWVTSNGELTVGKFNKKVTNYKDDLVLINQKIEQIYTQNKDKIRFVNASPTLMPVNGWVTSDFGVRVHPLSGYAKMHNGIDIASPIGTSVKSPADGLVIYSGPRSGYGNMVILDHGYGISTVFAHASQLSVKWGDSVKRGDVIAKVGSTGASTGPHLHYEVQVDGIPSDPTDYIVE
jgi:hypothetical protein